MFHEIDEALRQLLIREIPIRNGEVDVVFDQPTREWASRLSRPTLNLFLHNIRENVKLRGSQQWLMEQNPDGTVTQRRAPARIDLHYIITAWANEPDDEHNLLARALVTMLKEPNLPRDLLPDDLREQSVPIPVQAAQEDPARNPAEVWNALDNEMRPSVSLVVTVAVDPYRVVVTPLVRSRELRLGQVERPEDVRELVESAGVSAQWTIGGTVRSERSLDQIVVTLVERGQDVSLDAEGRFSIGRLRAGNYTLEIASDGQVLKRQEITVPAPDYDLEV